MSIHKVNAPTKSFDALKNSSLPLHHDKIGQDGEGNQHHYIPHRIYTASAFDLAAGKELANVQQTGWRYVIQDASGVDHVAQIGMDEEFDEHELHFVNAGGQVNSFIALYRQLQQHEHVGRKDYRVDMLSVSPCYVTAMWLKGVDHDHEFFIPLAPVNPKFKSGETYEYNEFMKLLQGAAQDVVGIPATKDDLTRIEGIGAKAAIKLDEAGYTTFGSIAAAQAADLEAVLKKAGSSYNLLDATTWPEQAQLATDGKWDELDTLQVKLKGGKRK